ncbi:hypothetical protein ABBQ32_010175 [Trebouxia sp. C0010 RCD-2024]
MRPTDNTDSADFAYENLASQPPESLQSPDLFSSESYEWEAIQNLDQFFIRVYRYYEEKGFGVIVTARLLNVLALAFTVVFSGFLLLSVKWAALQSECVVAGTCDIAEVAIDYHPFAKGATLWNCVCVMYLSIFSLYWLYSLCHAVRDIHAASDIRHFTTHKLGLSESQLKTVTWPEVAKRIVNVQNTTRLCVVRDLTEHDVVSRIMRKENYLIGMLNKGVLALHVGTPCLGLRKKFMLTKTLEWNLHWCLLDCMFGEDFRLKPAFFNDARALQRRFRRMAICNLLVSPFLMLFLLIYFFMRNAEKFYHHPSSIGARRWSGLAYWRMREFNELPHYIRHRLDSSHKAAEKYLQQFPSPGLTHLANFVAFIAGSFAALLLFMTLMDDFLLERDLFGRHVVWWAAVLGIILALSRALIQEPGVAFDPELALLEVVAHTHYLPRHWRGRAHTREVHQNFQALFPFKATQFVEEMASILLTPFVLYYSLPYCTEAILEFVRDHTVFVEGVGDICSLANFDFEKHGNSKYGAVTHCPKAARSRQGKMEKSFLSFVSTYPTWEPGAAAKQMLASLDPRHPLAPSPHYPFTSLYQNGTHAQPALIVHGARSSFHATPPVWSPSQPPTAGNMTDRGVAGAGQGLYGSMLGSVHMGQQQPGSAAHMASQLQLTASQLAAPHDPASYYEEQKREQMQGPALKRLEEEHQQQAQMPPLVPLHPRQLQDTLHSDQQQHTHQLDIPADDALRDPGQQQPSALQLNNARSWLGASRQLPQHQAAPQPELTWGELHSTSSTATNLGNSSKAPRPRPSPKPPLPSRPRGQLSSEMSYLGGSVGSSGTGASSDSNT